MSWVLPLGRVEDAIVEQIGIRVVAIDFEYFGNESPSRSSLYLDNDMERIRDVRFDGAVRQVNSALENTACKVRESLLRRICMNRGERPGVPGVKELQKVKRFSSANFA